LGAFGVVFELFYFHDDTFGKATPALGGASGLGVCELELDISYFISLAGEMPNGHLRISHWKSAKGILGKMRLTNTQEQSPKRLIMYIPPM
jgi:hypothetical protein